MDLIRKFTLCATLAAALFAVESARGQARTNVLTRGVGSTTAQSANQGSARGADPIFVAPQAGVNENATRVEAYDAAPSPAAARPNAIYAESSSEPSLEEEKAQAAAIIAQTKERAAARRHVVSRPINAPTTLKALKDKPQTNSNVYPQRAQYPQNRANPQPPRRPASAPQYLQYSPNVGATNAARPVDPSGWRSAPQNAQKQTASAAANQNVPALNWDGSTRKEYGRSQPPTAASPFAYDAVSTNPNDVNIDKASFAVSGFEAEPSEVGPQTAQEVSDDQQSSPVFEGFEPEAVGVPLGEVEGSEDAEDEIPPFVAPTQEALEKLEAEAAASNPPTQGPAPLGPATIGSNAINDAQNDPEIDVDDLNDELEVAIPTADDLLDAASDDPEIEPVAVEPVVVEPIAVEPSPVEPVQVDPVDVEIDDSTANSNDPIPVEPAAAEPAVNVNDAQNQNVVTTDDSDDSEESQDAEQTSSQPKSAQEKPAKNAQANEESAAPSPKNDVAPANTQNDANEQSRAQFVYDALTYATPAVTCAPELHPMANRLAPNSSNAYLSYAPSCATPQGCAPRRVVGIQAPVRRQPSPLVVSPSYDVNPFDPNARAPYTFAPECAPTATRPYGFLFGAEWLAWKTDADLPYARRINDSGATLDERDLRADGSGLRGRVGFRGVTGWDIIGAYTWFNQNDNGAVFNDANSALVSTKRGVDANFAEISGKLKTELQVVDVEVGKWIDRGSFAVRPFLGFRWSQLNLETTDSFSERAPEGGDLLDGSVSMLDGTTDNETAFSNALSDSGLVGVGALYSKSRLNAYGLRIGAEAEIALAQGLAIYGKGAGTFAVGDVKSYSQYVGPSVQTTAIKKTYFTPSLEAGLGLTWKVNGLEVRGGYEFNAWYNAANMNGRKSDFLAHGFVAGLGYNY